MLKSTSQLLKLVIINSSKSLTKFLFCNSIAQILQKEKGKIFFSNNCIFVSTAVRFPPLLQYEFYLFSAHTFLPYPQTPLK